ncbi:MAG TPA: SDR family oxidoreductase [Edaphobacter sp.]|nr:SDR family oxidoreductase [Edaphobacter sp.]
MNSFKDQVVIVTGGSSGIGRSAALQFATLGAHVLITGRRAERLDEAVNDHPNIEAMVAESSQPEDASRTISKVIELWGRLDVLVNNAGAGAIMPLAEVSAERVIDIFAVNVLGPSLLAKEALPHLKESKGSIINISSTYGSKAGAGLSHYGASKAALEYLTRAWALELAPIDIRVNAIAVGPTESGALVGMMGLSAEQAEAVKQREREQVPLGRRGSPEEVAHWIVSFANSGNEWVTGQVLGVDGGLGLT